MAATSYCKKSRILFVVTALCCIGLLWRAGYFLDDLEISFKEQQQKAVTGENSRNKTAESVNRDKNVQRKKSPKFVLVLTNKRSGSSFLGELFHRNPGVFYLFEPLYPYSLSCDVMAKERVETLAQLAKCDFNNTRKLYEEAFDVSFQTDKYAKCLERNLCFLSWNENLLERYKAERFGKFAKNTNNKSISCNSNTTGRMDLDVIARLCRRSSFVVFKTIRICDVSTLTSLIDRDVTDGFIDLKVIHLVRDPRAILSSRLKLQGDEVTKATLSMEAKLLCTRLRRNTMFSDSNWQGESPPIKYFRVRYEDMAANPHGVAREIYDFVGAQLPSNVKTWIKESVIEPSSKNTTPQGDFSLIRRTTDVLNGWRRRMDLKDVMRIQKHCNDVIKRHGYVTVSSEAELRNEKLKLW